ncbi:MAG: Crp/Fnr family transcriptional regulator [Bacteroidota bacterium]
MSAPSPIQQYLDSMKLVCPEIEDYQLVEFSQTLREARYQSRELIFGYQEIPKHVAYVAKGLVRAYYIDQRGDERTSWFIPEGDFATDYPAFLRGHNSNYYFETLEPSTVVYLSKEAIDRGYAQYPSLQKYGRLVAEEILTVQQARIESFQFKTAKERYLDFLTNSPELAQKISQGLTASYIGIERQSLTRIRKQLYEQK